MKNPVYQNMLIIQVQNICFSYTKCSNSCPYKCGFDYHRYRCFFNTDVDTRLNFSDSIFYDRNKTPPILLDKTVENVCGDSTCSECGFYDEEKFCKVLDSLRYMAKIKEGEC